MIPGSFDYHAPSTVAEAVALLDKFGDDAKVLAGGQSLIPMMKLRLAEPPQLVDINGIGDLSYIKEEDGFLVIGAMTREVDLDESELIKSRYPILHETSRVIADPLVRNLATVGGNLAHGDPANDGIPDLLLIVEFADTGTEPQHVDDVHAAVRLDERRRAIITMLIQKPKFTHDQSSRSCSYRTPYLSNRGTAFSGDLTDTTRSHQTANLA